MDILTELQHLCQRMEELERSIEQSQQKFDDEQIKMGVIKEEIAKNEGEIKALIDQRRSLQVEKNASNRRLEAISKRLTDLVIEADELKTKMRRVVVAIADRYIGKQEGVHLVNGKLAIARIRNGDKIITKLVPVMARASPEKTSPIPIAGAKNVVP